MHAHLLVFQKRARALRKNIDALGEQLLQAELQKKAFELLRLKELKVIPERKQEIKAEVDEQEKKQTQLQARYRELTIAHANAAQQQQ